MQLVILALFLSLLFLPVNNSANAQEADAFNAGCNPAIMQTMNKKAHMEAQRKLTIAQTYIKKPDSVLEYVCFGEFLSHAATQIGPIFSEAFNMPGGGPPLILGNDLQNAVGSAFISGGSSYLRENFGHNLFGGISEARDGGPVRINNSGAGTMITISGADYVKDQVYELGSGAGYSNCNVMAQVFEMARCIDFNEYDFHYFRFFNDPEAGEDTPVDVGGRSLADLDRLDALVSPGYRFSNATQETSEPVSNSSAFRHSVSCSSAEPDYLDWQNMLRIAFNEDPRDNAAGEPDLDNPEGEGYAFRAYLNPDEEEPNPNTDDQVEEPWLEIFQPEDCSAIKPIATGAVYQAGSGDDTCVYDAFCPAYGCTYTPNTNTSCAEPELPPAGDIGECG